MTRDEQAIWDAIFPPGVWGSDKGPPAYKDDKAILARLVALVADREQAARAKALEDAAREADDVADGWAAHVGAPVPLTEPQRQSLMARASALGIADRIRKLANDTWPDALAAPPQPELPAPDPALRNFGEGVEP